MHTTLITDKPKGALQAALLAAQPGDRIVYHIGPHCGGLHREDARGAYDAGLALLTTRRVNAGMFEHIAIRTKPKVVQSDNG